MTASRMRRSWRTAWSAGTAARRVTGGESARDVLACEPCPGEQPEHDDIGQVHPEALGDVVPEGWVAEQVAERHPLVDEEPRVQPRDLWHRVSDPGEDGEDHERDGGGERLLGERRDEQPHGAEGGQPRSDVEAD